MRIEAVCFTRRGQTLGERLAEKLADSHTSLRLTRCGTGGPAVSQWAAEHFGAADALLFIGAAGIAVRAIAPHIVSKTSDPAVLAADEGGQHVIPLLSGHIGGANALARRLAAAMGAEAIITTATDINAVFAVDIWASENKYHIQNPKQIKKVSARLLAGKPVTLHSIFPINGELPDGVTYVQAETEADISVTVHDGKNCPDALRLIPPALVLGIGCRRDAAEEAIETAFCGLCTGQGLNSAAFGLVCSIDLKDNEPGLLAFCKKHGWPLHTFGAEALASATGIYSASAFVKGITGVDNVCERSAVLGSGGKLLVKKTMANGVTLAVAQKNWTVRFGEDV